MGWGDKTTLNGTSCLEILASGTDLCQHLREESILHIPKEPEPGSPSNVEFTSSLRLDIESEHGIKLKSVRRHTGYEVLSPSAVGDGNQGDEGGDDDVTLLALRRQYRV